MGTAQLLASREHPRHAEPMRARWSLLSLLSPLAPLAPLSLLGLPAACGTSTTATPAAADAGAPDAEPALPTLGLNDVSVLVPIGSSPKAPGHLGPKDAGARGELLPQAVYDKIAKFGIEPDEGLDYARMRVVAIRFDGCFPAKGGCEPQIRLVMQPITDKGATLDSAIHLFYRLTEEELGLVVTGLRKLRAFAPEQQDSPLDVSPALVSQGMEGPYGVGLNELVTTYAGEENLVRMTFFLRAPPIEEEWFFGGFSRNGATMTPLDIVGVGKNNQRVNRPERPGGYEYVQVPSPTKPEDTTVLLTSAGAKAAAPADVEKALAAFARIENPMNYGPDQLPCAGCHMTTFVTEYAKTNLGFDVSKLPDTFKSTRDLTLRGEAATTPTSLRAFGFLGRKPMIGRRVVNETAAVLDDLEMRFPVAK